ncbi:MAG: radical SAM protein [Bacteroidales bacterium]|nr:radical SAM protein [Bacteroidales bacterium]
MKYLLLTPPLTQLNTPYPATTVLKGYLQAQGYAVAQADLGIELIDRIYSQEWLSQYAEGVENAEEKAYLLRCSNRVEAVMNFLRGLDNTLAPRIANRSFLPEGPRFRQLADMEWAFGTSGTEDKARYLATLFIEDIADYIREHTDENFDLIRYAEQIANFAPTFDEIEASLNAPETIIDKLMLSLLQQHLMQEKPDIVAFTIPFPGCLYGALRCGRYIKNHTQAHVNLGGGFVNTEWRQMSDRRIFNYCHSISFDDGELPLQRLAEVLEGKVDTNQLVRTITLEQPTLIPSDENVPFGNLPAPDFEGLPLEKYISMADMTNPMQRIWSQGRWNKMMMAHGCYWHRCAFCDTRLDYIGRYDAPTAVTVVDRMERVMEQTGISGFHFVDEALPPKLLREVCEEIIRRHLSLSFWGNVRFEKAYTEEFCDILSDAGCIAVSGGLEVASNRLLKLINKGVSIEQARQVFSHFRQSGIMVHAYLMYGFPTETLEETLEALDTVRQMFDQGLIQSAFWHRYAMTCHSPSGFEPELYGARRTTLQPHPFCNNEVDWEALSNPHYPSENNNNQFDYDIAEVGRGLSLATYNYMNGLGLEQPIRSWFPGIRFPKQKKHHKK